MSRRSIQSSPRASLRFPTPGKARVHRPFFESLEDRTMLDTGGPAGRDRGGPDAGDAVDGGIRRRPSPSYFVGEVENNQVTITYTVYNEQADPETGVLLTTTLEPGVTFVSSSVTLDGTTTTQLPDQSGQNLAWSLGTIQGYDRESVALTVNLPALARASDPVRARHRGAGLRHARRRRRLGLHARRDAAAGERLRPEPAGLDGRRQHDRSVHPGRGGRARLQPAEHLQLPAHADRLQLVPRLGPRRAGDALVELPATRSTSPAWAWP